MRFQNGHLNDTLDPLVLSSIDPLVYIVRGCNATHMALHEGNVRKEGTLGWKQRTALYRDGEWVCVQWCTSCVDPLPPPLPPSFPLFAVITQCHAQLVPPFNNTVMNVVTCLPSQRVGVLALTMLHSVKRALVETKFYC